MFQLPMRMSYRWFVTALTPVLLMLGNTNACAKCDSVSIAVQGSVQEQSGPERGVRVELVPAGRTRPKTPLTVEPGPEGRFSVIVLFDTFNGGGLFGTGLFGHDCSRRPEAVVVSLIEGRQVLGTQRLSVRDEFEMDSMGNYRLKRPLTLRHDRL